MLPDQRKVGISVGPVGWHHRGFYARDGFQFLRQVGGVAAAAIDIALHRFETQPAQGRDRLGQLVVPADALRHIGPLRRGHAAARFAEEPRHGGALVHFVAVGSEQAALPGHELFGGGHGKAGCIPQGAGLFTFVEPAIGLRRIFDNLQVVAAGDGADRVHVRG